LTQYTAALIGLALMVGALGLMLFAITRFARAARSVPLKSSDRGESAFMAAALQEAVNKLKEQERATHARAEASERLSSEIIASMTAGLLVVGNQGEVRTLNPAAKRLLSLPDGSIDRSFHELLTEAFPLAAVIDECLASSRPIVRRSLDMRTPGAARRGATHLGVTVSPIVDMNGHLNGAICLFTDLSAVAELEQQLRLRETLATLGELTAGIAHEFRNGLASIHGYARLIDPERLPDAYRPYLESIRQETQSLGEVVTNFLNFARPASLTVTPVDLQALVDRAAEEIRSEARARGGDVTVHGEFGEVEGDEVLLRQALSNLARNALEACVESERAPFVVFEGSIPQAGHARVTVTDNGPGIDPALADRIFQPFFTTRTRGTGLGLALVQKIVVTHNGRVAVSTAGAGGACFEVTLPVSSSRGER
jgi:signal transduction histidine kinase